MFHLVQYAMSFAGRPYKWGGETPMGGYDCSGFVQELLKSAGEDPPGDQTAQALFDHFASRGTHQVYAAGALAFYGKAVDHVTHVMFMIDQYRVIGASGGGSRTRTLDDAIRDRAFIKVRPLKYRKDLITTIKPRYAGIALDRV